MGRKRTTGCTARHFPGEPCRACEALRARLSRDRAARRRAREEEAAAKAAAEAERKREAVTTSGKPVATAAAVEVAASAPQVDPLVPDPERAALDKAAAEHRLLLQRALRHVATYRERGAIIPPDACERCGIGERLTPWSQPTPLVAWHPDPKKKTEVAWLCVHCRRHVRAVREPLTLTWVWPGGVPARRRGRPVVDALDVKAIEPGSFPIIEPGAEVVASRASLPGLAAELFLHAFLEAAGPDVEALYAQGARAGQLWTPLGDPTRDVALREWVARERASRARGERVAQVVPAWERRPRRDRLPLLPPLPPDKGDREPVVIDETAQARRMAVALERLSKAETKADAALERVQRALEQFRANAK